MVWYDLELAPTKLQELNQEDMSPEHIGLACDGSSSNPETTYFRGNWSKLSLKSQRSIFTVVCRRSYRKRQLCNQHSVCGNVRRTVNFGSEIDKRLSIPKVTRICLFRAGFITHSRIRQTIGSSCFVLSCFPFGIFLFFPLVLLSSSFCSLVALRGFCWRFYVSGPAVMLGT